MSIQLQETLAFLKDKEEVELNGLSEKAISQLHRVFACRKEIDRVLIYGSRAKGDFRLGSDLDLTLRRSNLTHNLMLEISN